MSTTHTLFYISTSCLESENEVLQKYVLRIPILKQVQDIILGYSEPASTFTSTNQSIFGSVESLMMKLLMAFILSWREFSQMSSACQRNGILIEKENAVAQYLALYTSQ